MPRHAVGLRGGILLVGDPRFRLRSAVDPTPKLRASGGFQKASQNHPTKLQSSLRAAAVAIQWREPVLRGHRARRGARTGRPAGGRPPADGMDPPLPRLAGGSAGGDFRSARSRWVMDRRSVAGCPRAFARDNCLVASLSPAGPRGSLSPDKTIAPVGPASGRARGFRRSLPALPARCSMT
jgi:hypothetical protein